jgi:hypothetical protein
VGEKRLMAAVLEDAVHCFQSYMFAKEKEMQRLYNEAREWIFSSDSNWVFSFEHICTILEVDAGYLRRGLKNWQHQQLAKRAA